MNEQSIQEQYQHIVSLLMQKRLKEAQSQLEAFLWNGGDWTLRNRLEQAQTSYQYMLQYLRQGVDDPDRKKLYQRLLAETWEIADQTRLILQDKVSKRYHSMLHSGSRQGNPAFSIADWQKVLEAFPDDFAVCKLMPDNEAGLNAALKQHEDANQFLFLRTWGNSAWSAEESRQAGDLLASELVPANDLCLFTSAVTLSLIECFDAPKLAWLMEAYTHVSPHVAQRALTGIAITLHCHPHRMPLYPELAARFSLLNEGNSLGKQLNRIYIQLLRSKETEKVDRKMREEIIPGMLKNVNLMRNMKFDFDENGDEEEKNPDWEKVWKASGMDEKMREMSELQQEGADVYMSTFALLKGYPFFNEACNWFLPFDTNHSSLIHLTGLKLKEDNAILPLILQSGFFCNSDKYSLCFTMAQLPPSQRVIMLGQIGSQDLDSLAEDRKSPLFKQYAERPEMVSNQYIQDVYRFFKLSSRRSELRDFFKEEIALHRIPELKEVLCKPELLQEVADFHFQKEHTAEALELYTLLLEKNQADADLFQKAGYCLQKEKRYEEAVEAYRKADLIKPDHVWTIRRLATCHRMLGRYDKALEYYQKAEEMQPDNRTLLFFTGSCLAESGRYDKALQYFFKLDFLENENIKTWRAIAWCSFLSNKYGQAMRYYEQILALKPTMTDYLNAGHVAWVCGNRDKTVEYYGKAIMSGSRSSFREMFDKDRQVLAERGIDEEDMPLILDLL